MRFLFQPIQHVYRQLTVLSENIAGDWDTAGDKKDEDLFPKK